MGGVIRCPRCESHNVRCESDRKLHRHSCADCGLVDVFSCPPAPPSVEQEAKDAKK